MKKLFGYYFLLIVLFLISGNINAQFSATVQTDPTTEWCAGPDVKFKLSEVAAQMGCTTAQLVDKFEEWTAAANGDTNGYTMDGFFTLESGSASFFSELYGGYEMNTDGTFSWWSGTSTWGVYIHYMDIETDELSFIICQNPINPLGKDDVCHGTVALNLNGGKATFEFTFSVISPIANGTCGDNVNWVLTDDGTLTISGSGEMNNYNGDDRPWYAYKDAIKNVVINDGVTNIGEAAFSWCSSLTSVIIANSVTSIGSSAFGHCSSLTSIICEAVTPPVCGDLLFYNVSTDIPVYVPKASLDAYKAADVWKNFTNIQAIPSTEPTPVPDTDISSYDNVIYTSNVKTYPGGKATLSIKMKNSASLTSYQFNLAIPDIDLSTAKATRTKTRKDDNVSLSSQIQSDGSYRVICYTTDDTYFSGNDGEVCTITFTVPEETAEGDYPVYITTTRLSDGNNTISINDSIKSTLTVEDYTLGDANCDGEVNVGDLSTIVKFILGTSITSNFNESAADANEDGEINVGDLSKIVKMILGINNSDVKSRIAPKTTADNQATMNAKSLEMKPGEDALMYVNLDNSMDVTSFQFDMQLPEGFTCENVTADYRRVEENASMNYAKMNENSTRVLCYSPSNETINGTSGNIAIIKIHADNDLQAGNYEATVSGIKVANADECKNVENFQFGISVGSATGIQGVMSDNNDNTTKYDMSGRAVNKNAQGIIISNGKKYLKK